jgi:hypothetical protein
MIKAETVTVDGKKGAKVSMEANTIECTNEAIQIVAALYQALKSCPKGEVFADIFCDALHEDIFKSKEELEEAVRKAEEQTDEANDFLRKFMDALMR